MNDSPCKNAKAVHISFCTTPDIKRVAAYWAGQFGMTVSRFCAECLDAVTSLPIIIFLREEMRRTGQSFAECLRDMYMSTVLQPGNEMDMQELARKRLECEREVLEQQEQELKKQLDALEQQKQTLMPGETQEQQD